MKRGRVIQHSGFRQLPLATEPKPHPKRQPTTPYHDHQRDYSRAITKLRGALNRGDTQRANRIEHQIDGIIQRWEHTDATTKTAPVKGNA
jgi:hypothetical protein